MGIGPSGQLVLRDIDIYVEMYSTEVSLFNFIFILYSAGYFIGFALNYWIIYISPRYYKSHYASKTIYFLLFDICFIYSKVFLTHLEKYWHSLLTLLGSKPKLVPLYSPPPMSKRFKPYN